MVRTHQWNPLGQPNPGLMRMPRGRPKLARYTATHSPPTSASARTASGARTFPSNHKTRSASIPVAATYTTHPGSRLFYPSWNVTTAELPPTSKPPPDAEYHGLMMPRRKRTRAADLAAAIKAERELNRRDIPPF